MGGARVGVLRQDGPSLGRGRPEGAAGLDRPRERGVLGRFPAGRDGRDRRGRPAGQGLGRRDRGFVTDLRESSWPRVSAPQVPASDGLF